MLNKTLSICKKLDLAICVFTSDSYSDVWDLFYFFWNKHFFSNQIPVYFLTSKQSKKTRFEILDQQSCHAERFIVSRLDEDAFTVNG